MKKGLEKFVVSHLFFMVIALSSCGQLPKEKYYQFNLDIDYNVQNDTLRINIRNPIHCPVRVGVKSEVSEIQRQLKGDFPVIIPPQGATVVNYPTSKKLEDITLKFSAMMGNPDDKIDLKILKLPFPKGRSYKIIQGYNGQFSHNSDYSKYAIDMALQEGDTVCSAADGFVVGVIKDYRVGGNSIKWRDYANFITVFHPEMNLFTQYVHLMPNGSLVQVGDSVKAGQPIGLSGMTGFTDIEHLHFNVLKADSTGLVSLPVDFDEGYSGKKLRKGDVVTH